MARRNLSLSSLASVTSSSSSLAPTVVGPGATPAAPARSKRRASSTSTFSLRRTR